MKNDNTDLQYASNKYYGTLFSCILKLTKLQTIKTRSVVYLCIIMYKYKKFSIVFQ